MVFHLVYNAWLKLTRPNTSPKRLNHQAKFVKITEQNVKDIFKEFLSSKDPLCLHKKYNISHANIVEILNRRSWAFVKIHPSIAKRALARLESFRKIKIISKEDRVKVKEKIFEMHLNQVSKDDMLKEVDISKEMLIKILNGSCWKHVTLPSHLEGNYTSKITQITKEKAKEIMSYYCAEGISIIDTINHFNIKENIINKILSGMKFKNIKIENVNELRSKYQKEIENIKIEKSKEPIYRKLNGDKVNQIIQLRISGKTHKEICKILDIGIWCVQEYLKRNNIK